MQSALVFYIVIYGPTLQYFSILSHQRNFRKKVIERKIRVSIFCTKVFWNIYYFKKNSPRWYRICTQVFMYSTRYNCHVLMKIEISRQIFEKSSNIIFPENPFREIRVVPCGRTEKWINLTKLLDAFRNFANAPNETFTTLLITTILYKLHLLF
jgi:hypothetical protein